MLQSQSPKYLTARIWYAAEGEYLFVQRRLLRNPEMEEKSSEQNTMTVVEEKMV